MLRHHTFFLQNFLTFLFTVHLQLILLSFLQTIYITLKDKYVSELIVKFERLYYVIFNQL